MTVVRTAALALAAALAAGSARAADAPAPSRPPMPDAGPPAAPPPRLSVERLDVGEFQVAEGPTESDLVYYRVVQEEGTRMLRAQYRPGLDSVVMAVVVPDSVRGRARQVRWRWRVRAFPVGGDECRGNIGDSAASVLVTWKRGMRWYMLKYVWSPLSPLGAICDRRRSVFLHRDTVVLERAGPVGRWLPELIDVRRAFREHFADGNPEAEVPDLVGIGVMSDGDQSRTESGADWADFEVLY